MTQAEADQVAARHVTAPSIWQVKVGDVLVNLYHPNADRQLPRLREAVAKIVMESGAARP